MTPRPEPHPPSGPDEADVLGWFRALEPRQPFAPSPALRAQVLAEVERRQRPRGWWARLTAGWSLAELRAGTQVAVATGALVVLSLAAWWGIRGFGPHPPDAPQLALHRQSDPAGLWPTAHFQHQLLQAAGRDSLGLPDAALAEPPGAYGFAPLPAATLHFRLGTGYAEALAFLQGGKGAHATGRVEGLLETLAQLQAPAELVTYLQAVQTLLQSPQTTGTVLVPCLAAFEPLYAAAYTPAPAGLTYFRLGTWLVNLSLAAAAGDQGALRQGPVIQAVRHALARDGAAPVVLDTLARLHALITQPLLTDREMPQIQALVQEVQRLLRD